MRLYRSAKQKFAELEYEFDERIAVKMESRIPAGSALMQTVMEFCKIKEMENSK